MLDKFNMEVPVLVSVASRGKALRCTSTLPKLMLSGTSFTVPVVRVIVAFAVLVASVAEVATSVTAVVLGRFAGAVYVVGLPLDVLAGETFPQAGAHGVP